MVNKKGKNKNKRVFWQAFLIAFLIFWSGILFGVYFEKYRASKLEKIFFDAETEIFDVQLQSELIQKYDIDCEVGLKETITFAEQIYEEAKQLEKYDSSTRITKDVLNLHRRYDLLRVMLWDNVIELQKSCPKTTNSVVYLYEYENPNTEKQARQITFSKVLLDLKKKHGDRVILIPIAYDSNIKSLEILKEIYNLDTSPIIVINQNKTITDLPTVEKLENYIN